MFKAGARVRVKDINGDREGYSTWTGMQNDEAVVFPEDGTCGHRE